MNLPEFAKEKISPTPDQEKALIAIDAFLNSNEKCFLLKGYAGTGKTTIIRTIAEYINYRKWVPELWAPTGRAARILSNKTGFEASTIHRGIYNLNDIDEIEILAKGKKQYKFRFNLSVPIIDTTHVYIIDEASMISDKKSETDFFIFGSGILLKDIIRYFSTSNQARLLKVIFVGDPAQLPPVSDPVSGALSSHYLWENYQLPTKEFELTQVVRQEKESGILQTAGYIRERLTHKQSQNEFRIDSHHKDISIIEASQVADMYIEQNPNLEIDQTAIINFSNKSALEYNLLVREKLFNNKYQIAPSDLLMINQNNFNYEIELYNGTMVKVLRVNPIPKIFNNIKSYNENGEECRVSLKFREITISVPHNKENVVLNCMILEDLLYNPNPQLDYSEHIALYLDFKIRHPKIQPKTQAFKDALKADPYFNALRVKYGYATTCHKAQGGEWKSTFVNLDLNTGRHSEAFNRWFYTAITRAREHLFIFNYNTRTPFSELTITFSTPKSALPQQEKSETIIFNLNEQYEELESKFFIDSREYFIREKFKEIVAIAHHYGYNITAHNQHNFQEQFTFESNGKRGTLIFWYNGQKKFTRITIYNTKTNDNSFCTQLLQSFNKPFRITFEEPGVSAETELSITETIEQTATFFPDGTEALAILYENLKPALASKQIIITQIVHHLYKEVYTFQRNTESAKIGFHYNSQFMFSNAFNLPADCNSTALLHDLENILTELINKK